MLKINLLPVRQLKKRAKARKQLFGMFLLFLLVLSCLRDHRGSCRHKKFPIIKLTSQRCKKKKIPITPTLKKIETTEKRHVKNWSEELK